MIKFSRSVGPGLGAEQGAACCPWSASEAAALTAQTFSACGFRKQAGNSFVLLGRTPCRSRLGRMAKSARSSRGRATRAQSCPRTQRDYVRLRSVDGCQKKYEISGLYSHMILAQVDPASPVSRPHRVGCPKCCVFPKLKACISFVKHFFQVDQVLEVGLGHGARCTTSLRSQTVVNSSLIP